jgi:hypothetical protein
MAATLNMHKVFSGGEGYLDDLRVDDREVEALRSARGEIRDTLKDAFRDWESHVRRAELFEGWLVKAADSLRLPAPKFRIQGSFAYATVNDCQITPPQQIDQDDGLFLPIGFLTTDGTTRPTIASKAYFDLVEKALAPLCASRGWTLNPGKLRDTCVRVEISSRLHIDLPLYAIRDDAFERLVETAQMSMNKSMTTDAAVQIELAEDVYRGLGSSEIMLAHRDLGWLGSDPRKLEDWFNNAIRVYGDQVRRVSRAFKGLRDARFDRSELSSICIMAAVVTAYERLGGQLDRNRDDLALMLVAREMADILRHPVENPVFPGQDDKCLCGWEDHVRDEICGVFRDAADQMEEAIHGTLNRTVALNRAKTVFGPRIPDDIDLISTIGLAQVIRQEPPALQPRPMPPRTKSG